MSEGIDSSDSVAEIRVRLDDSRFTLRQMLIVFICFMVNFVDGFDVIAIAMAAPQISQDWNINAELLGYILSAELVGMTVGAIVLSALSDKYGRRSILIPSVLLVAIATFLTTYTQSPTQLFVVRVITGLGVGGVLTTAATLASEFSPSRARAAVVTFVAMGFSVGSLLAGVVAAYSLKHYDWQMIFIFGASMGLVIFLLACFLVPESMEYRALQTVGVGRQIKKINLTLQKLGLRPLTNLTPPNTSVKTSAGNISDLLKTDFIKITLTLWLVFFAFFWANYGIGKWFPKLLVNDGFAVTEAISGLTIWVLGSVVGSAISSLLALKFRITKIVSLLLIYSSAMILLYILFPPVTTRWLLILMFLLGSGIGAGLTAMYSIATLSYPTRLRALGLGCCIGIGRTGAILAPIVTGYAVGAGFDTARVLLIVTLPAILLALFILVVVKIEAALIK